MLNDIRDPLAVDDSHGYRIGNGGNRMARLKTGADKSQSKSHASRTEFFALPSSF
jgi:hypothetical protein